MSDNNHYSAVMFGFNLLLQGVTQIEPKWCNFPVFETVRGLVGKPILGSPLPILFLTGEYKGQAYDPKYNGPVIRLCNHSAILEGYIHYTAQGITPVEYQGTRFVMSMKTKEAEALGLKRGDMLPRDWPETARIE